jgi:oxygen-independent coproporphyrinogen-3 oxidase
MKIRTPFLDGTKIRTIYFGGGTPSILSSDELNRLFDHLNNQFDLSEVSEITIEANPDDLTLEKIKAISKTPINRFSIGVQSFHKADLEYMNRAHNVEQAKQVLKMCKMQAGTTLL